MNVADTQTQAEQLLSQAREIIVAADNVIVPILLKYVPEYKKLIKKSASTSMHFDVARDNHGPLSAEISGAMKPWPVKMLLPITSMMAFKGVDTLQEEADLFQLAKALGNRLDGATRVYVAKAMKGEKDSFVEEQHNRVIARLKAIAYNTATGSDADKQVAADFIERVYEGAIMPISVNSQNLALNVEDIRMGEMSHHMVTQAVNLGLRPR